MTTARSLSVTRAQSVDSARPGELSALVPQMTRNIQPRMDGSAATALHHMQRRIGETPLTMENVPFFVRAIIRNTRGSFQHYGDWRLDLPSGLQIFGGWRGMAQEVRVAGHPTSLRFRERGPNETQMPEYPVVLRFQGFHGYLTDALPAHQLNGLALLRRAAVECCETSSLGAATRV
jgi:hypothetical protein